MTAFPHMMCNYVAMEIPRQKHTVDRDAFIQRLVYVREKLGLSKKEFAESIGTNKSNYGQVEAGNRLLTVDQIYQCFVVHGVPMEYLLAGQEARLPDHLRR